MKEKIISTVLVIMAVTMYTTAVINFIQGNVMKGVSDVLMACSDIIIAWVLMRQRFYEKVLQMAVESQLHLLKTLEKGLSDKLTVGKKDEDEDDSDVIPEDDLTEDEKRLKRMAEEYDQLMGRFEKLNAFINTDKFQTLSAKSRSLLVIQRTAMSDYATALGKRIELECDTANEVNKKAE